MNASDRKDLSPWQGFEFFRFFTLLTNCLKIVDCKINLSHLREALNYRKHIMTCRRQRCSFGRDCVSIPVRDKEPYQCRKIRNSLEYQSPYGIRNHLGALRFLWRPRVSIPVRDKEQMKELEEGKKVLQYQSPYGIRNWVSRPWGVWLHRCQSPYGIRNRNLTSNSMQTNLYQSPYGIRNLLCFGTIRGISEVSIPVRDKELM